MEANRNFIGNLPLFDNNEQSFESWLELFEEYCTLNNVPKESATSKVRKSLFLCHIGVKHYNMLHSICLPSKPNEKSIEELAKILREKYDSPDNVIEELCGIFSYVGLPVEIVSDNGPPFDSYRFINFCTKFNIKITKSPAYHPESNGFAERNVQIAKKALRVIASEDSEALDNPNVS
ncbi:unnamed protein product [Euphydryas editha]|uniref:Integrase catalytic domain-containing protein n=1 Tax=Euphydryas editha TaxID=104508 RepID=A0AAU9U6T5_EUPED|nr:unnamed protein product [Euphydryas editha]